MQEQLARPWSQIGPNLLAVCYVHMWPKVQRDIIFPSGVDHWDVTGLAQTGHASRYEAPNSVERTLA
jgi:hypothetical protein